MTNNFSKKSLTIESAYIYLRHREGAQPENRLFGGKFIDQ